MAKKSKTPKESDLYPIVERWMQRHFHCFKTVIDKGLRYERIDMFGVRDVGGDLSGEVETIAIEVKKGRTPKRGRVCSRRAGRALISRAALSSEP